MNTETGMTITLYDKGIESMFEIGENVDEIKVLNIHMNLIQTIENTTALSNLTELDISSNKLNNISGLGDLQKLQTLNISNNGISDISTASEWSPNLKRLVISYNAITHIEGLSSLVNLQELEAEGNQIENIFPIQGLSNLHSVAFQTVQKQRQCPVCLIDAYKALVLRLCPSIVSLDYSELVSVKRRVPNPQLLQYEWADDQIHQTDSRSEPAESTEETPSENNNNPIITTRVKEASRRLSLSHRALAQYDIVKQKLSATDETILPIISSLLKSRVANTSTASILSRLKGNIQQLCNDRNLSDVDLPTSLSEICSEFTTLKSHVGHLQTFASKVLSTIGSLVPHQSESARQKRDLQSISQLVSDFSDNCQTALQQLEPFIRFDVSADLPSVISKAAVRLKELVESESLTRSSIDHIKSVVGVGNCSMESLLSTLDGFINRHNELSSVMSEIFHPNCTADEVSETVSKLRQTVRYSDQFQEDISNQLNIPISNQITSTAVVAAFNKRISEAVQAEQIKTTKITSKCLDLQREVSDLKTSLAKLQQTAHYEVVVEELRKQNQTIAKTEAELRSKTERQESEIGSLKNDKHKSQMQLSAITDELRRRDMDYEQMRLDLRKRYSTDASSWDSEMRTGLQKLSEELHTKHQQDLQSVHEKYERALTKISQSYNRQKNTAAVHHKQLRAISELLKVAPEGDGISTEAHFEKIVESIINLKSTTHDNISHIQRTATMRARVTEIENKLDQMSRLIISEPFTEVSEEVLLSSINELISYKKFYSSASSLLSEQSVQLLCSKIENLITFEQKYKSFTTILGFDNSNDLSEMLNISKATYRMCIGQQQLSSNRDSSLFDCIIAVHGVVRDMQDRFTNSCDLQTNLRTLLSSETETKDKAIKLSEITSILQCDDGSVVKTVEVLFTISKRICLLANNSNIGVQFNLNTALDIVEEFSQLKTAFGNSVLETANTIKKESERYKKIINQIAVALDLSTVSDISIIETEVLSLINSVRTISGSEQLSVRISRLASEYDQQKRFLSEKERLIEHLLHEIDITKDDIDALHLKLEAAEDTNSRLEHNLKDSMKSLEKSSKEKVSQSEKKCSSYKRELEGLREQYDSETDTLAGKLRKSRERLTKFEDENQNLNSQISSIKSDMRKKVMTVAEALEKEKRNRQRAEEQLEQESIALASLQEVSQSDKVRNRTLQEQVIMLREKATAMEEKHRKLQELLQCA